MSPSIFYALLNNIGKLLIKKWLPICITWNNIVYHTYFVHNKYKKQMKLQTLEPSGKFQDAFWTCLLKNLSAAEIFLLTSINKATAISAASSEKRFPALATWIPRCRHTSRSMWLVPAVEVMMKRRQGRRWRMSALRGYRPMQRMAVMEEALWGLVDMNWWREGSEDGFMIWKLWEGLDRRYAGNSGGPWKNTFGRFFVWSAIGES